MPLVDPYESKRKDNALNLEGMNSGTNLLQVIGQLQKSQQEAELAKQQAAMLSQVLGQMQGGPLQGQQPQQQGGGLLGKFMGGLSGRSQMQSPPLQGQQQMPQMQGGQAPMQGPLAGMGITGISMGPGGITTTIGQTGQTKSTQERTQKAAERYDEIASSVAPLFGVISELETRAGELGDFDPGWSQVFSKANVMTKKFLEDPTINKYSGFIDQNLAPLARVLQQEKGPLTEKDTGRILSGLGKITAPLSVKKDLINELRKKALDVIESNARQAGISDDEIEQQIPGFSIEKTIQENMKYHGKSRDEVVEAMKKRGLMK